MAKTYPAIGERVGAILSADQMTVRVFGFGTYQGMEIPAPDSVYLTALGVARTPNHKILLDDGKVVWGGECWWDTEAIVKAIIGHRRVIQIDIEQYRNPGGAK